MPSTRSVVPERFRACSFDNFDPRSASQQKAVAAARRLAAGEIGSLVLIGPPGVGKTHLAAAVVTTIEERDRLDLIAVGPDDRIPALPNLPEWANVADLMVRLRLEIDLPTADRETAIRLRHLGREPGLVVLDDLGREKVTDWTGEIVYALINTRYEGRRPTLVTSNLSAAELAATPYWPAVSRLAEDGERIAIAGADHRLAR